MTKLHLKLPLLFSLLFLSSCGQKTSYDQMIETTDKVINSIKDHSEKQFIDLIGVDLKTIGKNEELLHQDFLRLQEYYKLYIGDGKITSLIIDTLNESGQKEVKIVFKKSIADQKATTAEIALDLYFGPPNLFGLDKITGYEIENNKGEFENAPIIVAPPPLNKSK